MMNKKVFNFFAGLFMAFAVMGTGCSNDELDYFVPDAEVNFEMSPLLKNRVFVVNPWDGDVIIPFSKEIGNPGFQFLDNHLNWEVKEGIEKKYLLLSLKEDSPKKAFLFRFKAPGIFANSETRTAADADIYLVCRALTSTSVDMPEHVRTIGQSVSLVDEILSVPLTNVLDVNRLYSDTCVVEKRMSESMGYEITGSRYKETVGSLSESLSISATIPIKSAALSGGFSQAYSEEEIASNKYEYHINIYNKVFADAHLIPSFGVLGADAYLPYITKEANELLNQPESALYKSFENNFEGIKKLYDTYGTHVLTGGVFGGTYIYVFGRKQTASFRSTSNAAGASLSLKFPTSGTDDKNWLQTYFRVMATTGGTISADGSDYSSEEESITNARSFFIVRGGNGSYNFDEWDKSLKSDEDVLELISYGAEDSYLIPLYDLVKEPARRKAMEENFEKYFAFYDKEMKDVPLVIADFMMKTVDSEDDIPEKKIMDGPTPGKKMIYYPLLLNKNFGEQKDRGKAVNTANDNFLAVAQSKAQVWWYALEYADECSPITHIAFLDKGEDKLYVHRGEDAETGMHWPAIDNHYVSLKFEKYNPNEKYITGVGLMHDDKIIATSAGTDMIYPFADLEQYNRYWDNTAKYEVGYLGKKEDSTSWFGKNNAAGHKKLVFPVFTKEPLVRPVKATPPISY